MQKPQEDTEEKVIHLQLAYNRRKIPDLITIVEFHILLVLNISSHQLNSVYVY